jgi:hypothetical protein
MTAAKVSSKVTAALFSKAVRLSRAATEGPKVGEVHHTYTSMSTFDASL